MASLVRPEDVVRKLFPVIVAKVDPVAMLPYLPCIASSRMETITCRQQNDGRQIAVQALLGYMRGRDHWFSQFINALRHPDIGLESLAEQLESEYNGKRKDRARVRSRKCSEVTENTLVRDLRSASLRNAFQRLALHGIQTWEDFADRVGYTMDDISYFKSVPNNSPASSLLQDWMTHKDATLGRLIEVLYSMERHDILTALQDSKDVGKTVLKKLEILRTEILSSQRGAFSDSLSEQCSVASLSELQMQNGKKAVNAADFSSIPLQIRETCANGKDTIDLQYRGPQSSIESGISSPSIGATHAQSVKQDSSACNQQLENERLQNVIKIQSSVHCNGSGDDSDQERHLVCEDSHLSSLIQDGLFPGVHDTETAYAAKYSSVTEIVRDEDFVTEGKEDTSQPQLAFTEKDKSCDHPILDGISERDACKNSKIVHSLKTVLTAAQMVYGILSAIRVVRE